MPTAICRPAVLCAALIGACLAAGATVAAEKPEIVGARLGLGDCYRVGRWAPLRVEVQGGNEPLAVQVLAATPDADGVGVGFAAANGKPLSSEPDRVTSQTIYVCPGSNTPVVELSLIGKGKRQDRRVFSTGDPDQIEAGEAFELGAASRENVVLQLGADAGGTLAIAASDQVTWRTGNAAPIVNRIEELPNDAIGYDAFDSIILLVGSRAGAANGDWFSDLTPDDPRVAALLDWVDQGGRLVLSCGTGGAGVIGPGGALESITPGKYVGPESLNVVTAIEGYAEAPDDVGAIALDGRELTISGLSNTSGTIEAFAGRSQQESPLVIRNTFGFGEVTFVAFDLDDPAISGWKGRSHLLRQLLRVSPPHKSKDNYYEHWNRSDVADSLLTTLDTNFTGVRTAPFIAIVGLVLLYLLLIGPGDYFFVKNVLGRMEATWVTFPLIVVATSAAAYFGAFWLKGDRLKVNQVEVIDIDTTTGRSRGLLVTDVFSPRADRYTVGLTATSIDNEPLPIDSSATGWINRSSSGFGNGTRSATGVRSDYRMVRGSNPTGGSISVGTALPGVVGLPIQVWSTKALVSRYSGPCERTVEADLTRNSDALVAGSITNKSSTRLLDCRLLYGEWAWNLGTVRAGESVDVRENDLVKVNTFLTSIEQDLEHTDPDNAVSAGARLISIGSRRRSDAEPINQLFARSDLAPHLDAGRALLLARVDDGPRSQLMRIHLDDGESRPLITDDLADDHRNHWVFVNFILPVTQPGAD